jgi:hypothetical protein
MNNIPLNPQDCKACEAYQNNGIAAFCPDHDEYDIPAFDRGFADEGDIAIQEQEDASERLEIMTGEMLSSIAESYSCH